MNEGSNMRKYDQDKNKKIKLKWMSVWKKANACAGEKKQNILENKEEMWL